VAYEGSRQEQPSDREPTLAIEAVSVALGGLPLKRGDQLGGGDAGGHEVLDHGHPGKVGGEGRDGGGASQGGHDQISSQDRLNGQEV
jgi:hypothetical protein